MMHMEFETRRLINNSNSPVKLESLDFIKPLSVLIYLNWFYKERTNYKNSIILSINNLFYNYEVIIQRLVLRVI